MWIAGPFRGQEQPQAERQGERDERLAASLLAKRAAVLPGDPDRVGALLGQGGVVDDQERVGSAQHLVGLAGEFDPAAIGCRLLRSPGPSRPCR